MSEPRSLAELLARSEPLRRLRAEADERRRLTERVRAALPPAEGEHLVGAHLTPLNELVLVLDAPVWAARARYLQPEMLRDLDIPIARIRVQARPRR